jgi:hypothetical protein
MAPHRSTFLVNLIASKRILMFREHQEQLRSLHLESLRMGCGKYGPKLGFISTSIHSIACGIT